MSSIKFQAQQEGKLRFISTQAATALCLSLLVLPSAKASGQGQGSNFLSQMAASFSGGQVVQQIQIIGTASWNAGSLQDTGTVTLTASADGSSLMQLSLAVTGPRTETQTGAGSSANCQWAGADGIGHQISLANCWKPEMPFFPELSLQPSLLPSYVGIADLGLGSVGSGSGTYRHLQTQLALTGLPAALAATVTQQSTTDLGLDPVTLLPAILSYSVLPDSGPQTPISIEIRYSNYQTVNGVQIPFTIQRYVNGSLQLAISVSSVQIA
jgi:hypothetical protein